MSLNVKSMGNQRFVLGIAISVGLFWGLARPSLASDEPLFLVRGKAGYSLYQQTTPVSGAFTYGLDFGVRLESGFSITAVFNTGKGSGQESVSTTVTRERDERLTLFGMNFSYGFEKAGAIFYFGPTLGLVIDNSDITLTDSATASRTSTSSTPNYFGIGALVGLDLPLNANYFATVSTEFITAVEANRPWWISIRGGLGFSF